MPRTKVEEKDITASEALDTLSEDENPGPIEAMMVEHLKEVVKLDPKSSKELVKELTNAGVMDKDAVMLANLLPDGKYEVISLLSGGSKPYISEETAEKIVTILRKFLRHESKREDKQAHR